MDWRTFCLLGRYKGSSVNGNGVSYPHTLSIGASRWKKHLFCIYDANSAPIPLPNGASCDIITHPVFLTLLTMVS